VSRYVVFSHGQESGPWGRKISALAEVARSEGYETESVDYRGIDHPRSRITRLVDFCKELQGDLVLVGSSMGGFVSVASASLLHARGVFLHQEVGVVLNAHGWGLYSSTRETSVIASTFWFRAGKTHEVKFGNLARNSAIHHGP